MGGKSRKILFYEVKTNILSLGAFVILLTVFWGLGMAMLDFSINIPKNLEMYVAVATPIDEFKITLSWMNEEKFDVAKEIAESYATGIQNIEGEKNHISGMVVVKSYSECEKIIIDFSKHEIQTYSEAYEIIKPIYDDIVFFRQVFLFLAIVMMIALVTIQYSGISMVLKRRKKFMCMLQMLGYSKKTIRGSYALIFGGSIILIAPFGALVGLAYERYASLKLTALFGVEYMIKGNVKMFIICSLILCLFCMLTSWLFVINSDLEERKLSLAEMGKRVI